MNAGLLDLMEPARWPTFALASARVVGLVMIAPIWSLSAIPVRLRGAIAVVLTLAMLPVVPDAALPTEVAGLVGPMASELLLGTVIGLGAVVFVHGVAVAAEVIALQMGLSLGAALGGTADMGDPGIAQLEVRFALVSFAILGGPVALVAAVARSFHAIPPGGAIDLAAGTPAVVALGSTAFVTAVRVAAPLIAALLATNVALAILNRAVPQLNTMMVAVPVTVGIGLVVLGASLPYTVPVLGQWVAEVGPLSDHLVAGFVPAGGR